MNLLRRVLGLLGNRSGGRREAPGGRGGRGAKGAAGAAGLGAVKGLLNKRRRR